MHPRSTHVRGRTDDGSRTLLRTRDILAFGSPGGPIEAVKLDTIPIPPHSPINLGTLLT
jgi:hypothetical protein